MPQVTRRKGVAILLPLSATVQRAGPFAVQGLEGPSMDVSGKEKKGWACTYPRS